jgi:ADP-ribose pyrophosphatase YjhB (NUDIX family)
VPRSCILFTMAKAARAIIIRENTLLVMHRDRHGAQYYTLVGGRINDGETAEQAVVREVREETGLNVTQAQLVFIEKHPAPYDEQDIFLCEVESSDSIALQDSSEEALMNRVGMNLHTPQWIDIQMFPKLPFNTMQLQKAITDALQNGFPTEPIKL